MVKMGNDVSVATGLVTVEANPSWTPQRAPYNHWVTCRLPTSTPSWTPGTYRGRLLSALNQSSSAEEGLLYLNTFLSGEMRNLDGLRFIWFDLLVTIYR